MTINYYKFTSQGGRDRNEDAVAVVTEEDKGIFAVADGLGGHRDGNLASQSVVSFLSEAWTACEPKPTGKDWIEAAILEANKGLRMLQEKNGSNMKSTIALLLTNGERSAWANVGDSRVYYIRDGELARVTEDHSVAFLKFKMGEISRFMLTRDPDQSRLLRSLGDKDRYTPEIYENPRPLKPGDAFLLCSDGLWEYLNDQEVAVDYLKSENAREWAESLLLRAVQRIRGGNDNLSLITVMITDGESGKK